MSGPIDYLDPDIPLADVALHLSGRLDEMRADLDYQGEVATRYDEGIAAMQWNFSRLQAASPELVFGVVPLMAVLGMLDEIVVYASVGKVPVWLEHARREMA